MMCSIFESAAFNFRETDDLLNPVGAACATGVIYKITAVRRSQASQQRVAAWSPRKLAVVAGVHHERPSSTLTHKPASSASSQGPRIALSAGLGLGAMAAAGSFVTKSASSRGMLKNFL
tara:strand:+ start:589 stop:945 length:357 start_codon:yes stop_codon:yes gene_type:complete